MCDGRARSFAQRRHARRAVRTARRRIDLAVRVHSRQAARRTGGARLRLADDTLYLHTCATLLRHRSGTGAAQTPRTQAECFPNRANSGRSHRPNLARHRPKLTSVGPISARVGLHSVKFNDKSRTEFGEDCRHIWLEIEQILPIATGAGARCRPNSVKTRTKSATPWSEIGHTLNT